VIEGISLSFHSNSMRPIRRVFENLSMEQMLQLETPQDCAMIYGLQLHNLSGGRLLGVSNMRNWDSLLVYRRVKLSTDPLNPLKKY
jgi:hypothetical protein